MPTKPSTDRANADKRLFFISVGIFVLVSVFAIYTVIRRNAPTSESALSATSGVATQIPAPVPVIGDLAEQVQRIAKMVEACPDYSAERRTQMKLHIGWLLAPDTIPDFMKIPLGSNPTGRLIEGMATYTLSDWGQHKQDPNSCLLPIGKQLNVMMTATGVEPIPEFK